MLRSQEGFTLVELSTGMVAGTILVLAFTSILVFSRNQSTAATQRVNALQDVWVLDEYIHKQLIKTMSDSVLIYADSTAEQSDSPSNSGSILRTADIDGNSYRIATSNQSLTWEINGTSYNPVDAKIPSLSFQESSSSSGKKVNMGITFLSGEDTLAYEWIITFRN